MNDGYLTLLAPHEVEIDKVKRSRFIGLAAPCSNEEEASAFLQAQRKRFHDARHHCWAWRLGDQARSSDDGEPHHSAGAPILREIEGRGLRNVMVVVVRWFGGVKLGTGGLVRAYGAAAAAVLEASPTQRMLLRVPLCVEYDYAEASGVQRCLHQLRLEPATSAYEARVRLVLHLPAERVEEVAQSLREACAGRVVLERLQPVAVPQPLP